MNAKQMNRLLSMLLAFTLVVGLVVPVAAVGSSDGVIDVQFEKVENASVPAPPANRVEEPETPAPMYEDTDEVRVSIFLEDESTLDAGFSTLGLSENDSALSYRDQLLLTQEMVTEDIEDVTGSELDVVWNLTLAANAISANVTFGDIDAIEELPGVEKVVVETRYVPQTVDVNGELEPNMVVSAQMTGTNIAWKAGFSGAGTRIAIIDTGLDVNHQSMDNDAFLYALRRNAEAAGLSFEEYVASLDLLDTAEIAEKLPQLNLSKAWDLNPENTEELTADMLYLNEKLPLAFCYVDKGLGVSHEFDMNTEHGSHVAGIAAANRFIENADGTFTDAGEAVGLVGNAPDAQLLVMKVFGVNGGAYDADYLAAIEDAIMLGCDSVNLSLGSAMPGMSLYPEGYGEVMETMKDSDTVVCISMGNNGVWGENVANVPHLPYVDHQNFFSGGAPGSFVSPLTIGSVDNDGIVGNCFQIAGGKYTFNETPVTGMDWGRQAFMSLDTSEDGSGTSYGYVFLDALGNPEDFAGIDCTGKIVFLSRGAIPFTDKAANAVAAGAAGVIIYNTEPGVLGMNLDLYFGNQPVVSIMQSDADLIRAASTEAQTEAGVTYYTGEFFIDQSVTAAYYDSDYLNMSLFSSWGAPGNLTLKPEIVAPGGNIFSMNGTHLDPMGNLAGGTDSYEHMSGTSMAAPQMSGISALVLQAIEERSLSVDGLTNRALAQSLMMSTARPMVDAYGAYYPLIQQGAGVVDTAAAVSADSCVVVEGQDDGKAKAELGDDPERTGVYTFTFTLHNLDGVARTYSLYADVFGHQGAIAPANAYTEEPAAFITNSTMPFVASTSFTADGNPVLNAVEGLENCDFNGDGEVNIADGQALLDFVVGNRESVENADYADLSADGKVNTYDVHAFLKLLNTAIGVEVPANGSVEITATISLTEEMKQALSEFFTAGNFVYAYVHAIPDATAEGEYGTAHSIPMLAYYGRWSDNSLFDVGTFAEHSTGDEIRATYFNNKGINSFTVAYGDRPDVPFYFGCNPVQPDQGYKPERNAINSERGDMISELNIAPIRNGVDSRFVVRQDGEAIYTTELDSIPGAFFYWGNGSWQNTVIQNRLDWSPAGLQEGDEFELSFEMATEYYLNPDYTVRWDELGEGSRITVPAVVDNTAPMIDNIALDLINNTMVVTATDNQYVSGVILNNITGTEAVAQVGANQEAKAGETHDFVLDLDGVNGKKFLLQVADYAANISTYELEVQIGEELPTPEMMVFSADTNAWISDDYYCESGDYDPSMYRVLAVLDRTMSAATVIGDRVYSVSTDHQLFVAPLDEMNALTYVAQLPYGIADMTLDRSSNTVYAVNENNDLVTIDPMNGECAVVAHIGIPTDTLALDGKGNFYCAGVLPPETYFTVDIYTFTLETAAQPELFQISSLANRPAGGELTESMEYNPNDGMIYWYGCYRFEYIHQPGGYGFLFRINPDFDPETATEPPVQRFDQGGIRTGALIITEQNDAPGGDVTAPVEDVQLSETQTRLHRGLDIRLDAAVRPWTVADRSVIWTTSDPAVAAVDENGHVVAVDVGTAVITATSNQDPSKSASCTVTVDTVDLNMKGVLKDAEGQHQMFHWNLSESASWIGGLPVDAEVCSVAYDGSSKLYINNAVNDSGNLLVLDEATGELVETIDSKSGAPLWDMACCGYDDAVHLTGVYRWLMFIPGNPAPEGFFDLSGSTAPLFGIVCHGVENIIDMENQPHTAIHMSMLDGECNIIDFWAYDSPQGPQGILDITPTDLDTVFRFFDGVNKRCSLVTDQYGNLVLSYYNPETVQNDIYILTYDAESVSYKSELIAHMGKRVWPAALYEVVSGPEFAPAEPVVPSANALSVSAETLTEEELSARIAEMSQRDYETPVEEAEEDADPVDGSLNSVVPQADEADEDLVNVTVSADNATTNGLITVKYDAGKLALVDAGSRADLSSKVEGEGEIRLGYAYAEAVDAGTELLNLYFERLTDEETEITVTVVEENDQEPNRSETVVIGAAPVEPEPSEPDAANPEPSETEKPEKPEKPVKPGDSPDTGDPSGLLLWVVLCIVSVCGAAVLMLRRKSVR